MHDKQRAVAYNRETKLDEAVSLIKLLGVFVRNLDMQIHARDLRFRAFTRRF